MRQQRGVVKKRNPQNVFTKGSTKQYQNENGSTALVFNLSKEEVSRMLDLLAPLETKGAHVTLYINKRKGEYGEFLSSTLNIKEDKPLGFGSKPGARGARRGVRTTIGRSVAVQTEATAEAPAIDNF